MSREKAVRALHEAKMHDSNIFLTLTYNEESLSSQELDYRHWQLFMKKLRYNNPDRYMPFMVTGEYGDKNKRPHWHAILFNYQADDAKLKYTTERQEKVYESEELTKLWGKGNTEFGSVTIDSAGYVARYAAKKLVHGNDQDHNFHPIHRTSCKRAIGRSWIEKYYKHTFENGYIYLPNGEKCKIPRYYHDWAKEHKPELYGQYMTRIKLQQMEDAELRQRKEEMEHLTKVYNSYDQRKPCPLTRNTVKERILQSKFKQLQERLKL